MCVCLLGRGWCLFHFHSGRKKPETSKKENKVPGEGCRSSFAFAGLHVVMVVAEKGLGWRVGERSSEGGVGSVTLYCGEGPRCPGAQPNAGETECLGGRVHVCFLGKEKCR